MPEIIVKSLNEVLVDGASSGDVLSVLANYRPDKYPGIQAAILSGLQAWHDRLCEGHIAELAELHSRLAEAHKAECQLQHEAHDSHCEELCGKHEAGLKELRDAHAAEISKLQASHELKLVAIREGHAANVTKVCEAHADAAALASELATKTLDKVTAEKNALQAKCDEQQAQIDALGGTELGQKMANDAKRQALLDAKAKAEAELAALDGVPADA